jgi:hypothetical protein
MDIEAKKIKSPYKPSSDYFSDLAIKIQQKAGIEPIELGLKQEKVAFKPAVKEPIQLTVEFGFPLTTQRSSEPDISMPEAPLPAISNLPTEIETPEEKVEVIESKSIDQVPGTIDPVPGTIDPVTGTLDQVPGTLDPLPGTLDPAPGSLDPVPGTLDPVTELEFSDEDLDRLHAEMTGESFVPTQVAFEKDSNPVKTQKTPAVKVEKSTAEISDERIPLWAMIPWSSLLGVVASLFAVAAAWFIWNQIQKPLTVEQRVARAVQSAPAAAAVSASPEKKELDIEALPASHQVIYDMIQEGTSTNKNEMNFNQMPEQSRISSVELERNGLTVLDLEDQIFDEIEL